MDERKLNLNAPLLSVRRFSSPVRAAGAVKDNNIENPKLDRIHKSTTPNTDSSLEQVTETVAVPFHWEQIPGRRKDGGGGGGKTELTHRAREVSVASPRFPIRWVPGIVKNQDDKRLKVQTSVTLPKSSSALNYKEADIGNENEEDDDDKYSDALESLSGADSCSMKCSVSSDCAMGKPSGTFSTDPQTRNFMMRRFLPAAKAMALEQSQYASTKKQQHVVVEPQPRQIEMAAPGDKSPTVRRWEYALVPYYPKDLEPDQGSEEEGDECDEQSVNLPSKACGFFPRLCFKNSVCLLNPVPGMKVRSLPSLSSCSTPKVKKPSKPPSSRSTSPFSRKSCSKDVSCPETPSRGAQSPRLANGGSDSFNNAHDRQMAGRISPFSRRSGGLSPYRSSAPQSPFSGLSKEAEMFKASKPYLYCKGGSKSQELTPVHRIRHVPPPHTSGKTTTHSKRTTTPELVRGEESLKALVCLTGKESPLPLPKTPSESWLWRTLPVRNSVDRDTSFQSKWLDSKSSSKWETMVKSSYMHHDHVRYSEELIPQHLKI
ncbi:hypothetical protein LINGRAHAP2_LOCUS5639 [Linum grandiflorum]